MRIIQVVDPRQKQPAPSATLPLEHYARLLYHRKWVVLSVFALVAGGTFFFAQSLPNIYQSETVILVDPQKVPESYVKSTVTGDIRNRLGTLSQQILSATRLQKIIDTLNLYPEERKTLAREDVITKMRSEISHHDCGRFWRQPGPASVQDHLSWKRPPAGRAGYQSIGLAFYR